MPKEKTFKNKDEKLKLKNKSSKFLAVILRTNKSFIGKWVSLSDKEFRHDRNTYFTVPDGMYLNENKTIVGVYLEGISTPLGHQNIETKKVERNITLPDGNTKKVFLKLIKGLKFDSEIIDILLNRGLAEKFTEIKPEKTIFILIVLVIINIITSGVAIGVHFL